MAIGVLREMSFGREELFVHGRLLDVLTREENEWASLAEG